MQTAVSRAGGCGLQALHGWRALQQAHRSSLYVLPEGESLVAPMLAAVVLAEQAPAIAIAAGRRTPA